MHIRLGLGAGDRLLMSVQEVVAGSEIRGGGFAKRKKEGRIISSSIDRLKSQTLRGMCMPERVPSRRVSH